MKNFFLHTTKKSPSSLVTYCLVLPVFFLLPSSLFSQYRQFFTYVSVSPITYSYYINNKHHTGNNKGAFTFAFAAREEWRFVRSGSLVIGAEFFSHGLSFNSYFFAPNRSFLYDKNFAYKYKVRVKEFDFPVMLRGNFTGLHRKNAEGYFEVGASLRYLQSASMYVEDSTGIPLFDKATKIEFETPFISRQMSMWMQFNWGINFYHADADYGFFMEMNFRYSPLRFEVEESFTPADLKLQSFHAGLGAGFRF